MANRTNDSHNGEWTDRYGALGLPLPDPKTVCRGACEGTGCVPVWFPTETRPVPFTATVAPTTEDYAKYHEAWLAAEREDPAENGWHFVSCPDCGGTGKLGKRAADAD